MSDVKILSVLFASYFLTSYSLQEVCIISNSNNNSSCKILNDFCDNLHGISDGGIVTFLTGTHRLNTTCEIKSIKDLILRGEIGSRPVIACSVDDNSGFRFLNVSNLKISGIEFRGCGSTWIAALPPFGGLYTNKTLTALMFVNGANLSLTNVVVSNAKSAGIFIHNVAGNVTVDSCKVDNASSNTLNVMSGNVVVYDSHKDTQFYIANSQVISSGYRRNVSGDCKTDVLGLLFYSSGFAMFLGSSRLTVDITNTNFSHNTGCSGANLALLCFSFKSVTISYSNFTGGRAGYGGGLYLSFQNSFLNEKHQGSYNQTEVLKIVNSRFENNHAAYSGGGAYIRWRQSLQINGSSRIEIIKSRFSNNSISAKSQGGLALYYKTYSDNTGDQNSSPKFHVALDISNSTFSHHYPNGMLSESSVILAETVPYLGINGITVESNNCTAILAIASTLVFSNSTTIFNNTALSGAGVRLCSDSIIYLKRDTNLTITNNSATSTGGGIKVYPSCLLSLPACFYQYHSEIAYNNCLLSTVNFNVTNNNARNGGNNIYGGSINYCYFIYVNKELNYKYKHPLRVPNNSMNQPSSISSDPQHVCFNYSKEYDGDFECNQTSGRITIYPGEKITVPVRVVGQSFGTVSGTVVPHIPKGLAVDKSEIMQRVDIPGGYITYTVYSSSIDNYINRQAEIKLNVDLYSDISFHVYRNRFHPAEIEIQFKKCPFGFFNAKMTDEHYSCQCPSLKHLNISCFIHNQTIVKQEGLWVGEFRLGNHTYLAFSRYCPLDYCKNSFRNIHSNPHNLSQDEQCQYNRTGVLCGACPPGWSLVLGSSECRDNCSNVWLLLILPFALAGLLLVVVIHFLNLTVTMGTVCGLIFYANIIQDYSVTILSSHPIRGLTPILLVFLSWLNLDLGISTCFYDGMEAFGKTMLLFVFPIYIWLISAIIVVLSNRYIFFTRFIGENALKVLSTLFLLSYSKMLRVAIGALNLKVLYIYTNNSTVSEWRWVLDGNVPYFDSKRHLVLALIAVVFIMFLLPFTLSLLCIRHVYSLSNCWKWFSWMDKLKPFFDTYTGPFKDKARFWTGLLLLVRMILLAVHIADYRKVVLPYYYIILSCLLLLAIMIALQGVYKSHYLNVLECFFILNISVIFLTLTYKTDQDHNFYKSIVFHLLVSSAFLVFLGIVVYHVYLKFYSLGCTRRLVFCWHHSAEMDLLSFDGVRSYD